MQNAVSTRSRSCVPAFVRSVGGASAGGRTCFVRIEGERASEGEADVPGAIRLEGAGGAVDASLELERVGKVSACAEFMFENNETRSCSRSLSLARSYVRCVSAHERACVCVCGLCMCPGVCRRGLLRETNPCNAGKNSG